MNFFSPFKLLAEESTNGKSADPTVWLDRLAVIFRCVHLSFASWYPLVDLVRVPQTSNE